MKQKKKLNSTLKKTVAGLLIILLIMGAVTLARYSSAITGTGTASVALYQNDAEFTLSTDDIPRHPGDSRTIDFNVTNTKDTKTAEVAQTYEFTVETAENIPFVFELSKDDGATWKTVTANTKTDDKNILSLSEQTDNWKIKITWPDSASDSKYANEIEYVRVCIHLSQKEN